MELLAISISVILVGLALIQGVLSALFARLFVRPADAGAGGNDLPRAAVLLSLRGADPYLAIGLRRLMRQNYPDYELRIVIDHENDPAWELVRTAMRETGAQNVRVDLLRERSENCGLKCSALVQLARDLDDSFEVIILADADLVSHADWMRELVEPLQEDGIGAAHGNRWFMPRFGHWGSLVRYLWNVPAVVLMYLLEIPWGGTFAMRTSVLRQTDLAEKWAKAVVEDAPIRSALDQEGLRVKFVPSLMMVNREDCGLAFSLDFIKRQLTWTRLYHPRWAAVVLHAAATTGVQALAILLAIYGVFAGRLDIAAWAGGGWVAYLAIMLVQLVGIETVVRRRLKKRDEETAWLSLLVLVKMLPAIPLTQGVHMLAVTLATFRRYVTWRGVTYHLRDPWDVRMVDYRPFRQPSQPADSNTSL